MEDLKNEEYIEAQVADCEQFLAETDWEQAQAVIDNLYDIGATSTAVYLRKKLLNAQMEYVGCSCPKGGEYSDGTVCPKCDGTEWITVRPERADFSASRLMNNLVYGNSELNPNRGDAPY